MTVYPEVVVLKSELVGIPGRRLFRHIRKLTAERGLFYTDPTAPTGRTNRTFKYLPIQVWVERDRIIYRNVEEETESAAVAGVDA